MTNICGTAMYVVLVSMGETPDVCGGRLDLTGVNVT